MSPPTPSRWIGGIAVAALLAGLGMAVMQWRAGMPKPAPAPGPVAGEPHGERAIDQALALAVDSTVIKSRWIDDVSAMDLASLAPARREVFLRFANAERCTCGCGYTLAGCRASDMSCEVSGPHLTALLDSVRNGSIRNANGVRERPHAASP
jgi:hypothetical protein